MPFKISSPVRYRIITQNFGENYFLENGQSIYKSMGMLGHDAQDLRGDIGDKLYAVCDGVVKDSGIDSQGGRYIKLWSEPQGENGTYRYEFLYYHCNKVYVLPGMEVKKRELIGEPDKEHEVGEVGDTGKYVIGSHLHFRVREYVLNNGKWKIKNWNNGYHGAINPQYFYEDNQESWLPVDEYYGRKRTMASIGIEAYQRFHNQWLQRYVRDKVKRNPPKLSNRETNAIVYGGWGVEEVFEPSMYPIWTTLKKSDYKLGKKPPIRV